MEIKVSEQMSATLAKYKWDLNEIKLTLPEIFNDAKCIQIVDCDNHYITVNVDDKRYLVDAEGQVWR